MKFLFSTDNLALLQQVANGNEKAFRLLYDRYRNQVFYVGFKFLKSEAAAEDVLQEVFSKIWINRKKLAKIIDFSKYLNTLTLNYIYNLLRRKAHEEAFLHEELVKINLNHEEAFSYIDLRELEDLLHKAVKQLSPQQKKVFELSRVQGLKHEEIAKELNISRETVKKHIMEALSNVRSFLAAKGDILINLLILILLLK